MNTTLPPPVHHQHLPHSYQNTPLGTRMESLLYVINEQKYSSTPPAFNARSLNLQSPPTSLPKISLSPPSMSIANLVNKASTEENRITVTEPNTQILHTAVDSCLKRKASEDVVPRPHPQAVLRERIRCILQAGNVSPALKRQKTIPNCLLRDSSVEGKQTTVRCYHASIAQKSYGSEKRFLCPPPLVTVIGPGFGQRTNPVVSGNLQLSMSIGSEAGDLSLAQKSPLDANGQASFKYLHVGGTAKAKTFQLKLEMSQSRPSGYDFPIAAFESAPIGIISKPSKKTAKSRNVTSCILSGSTVSLFNRINSQTVRTKYMDVDAGVLCAKNSSWSPFTVTVVSPPPSPLARTTPTSKRAASKSTSPSSAVAYGSEILLVDTATGLSSGPFVIRKVDKNRIVVGATGPVIQMQKIALERVAGSDEEDDSGPKEYLSASGASSSTPTRPSVSRSPSPVSEDGQTNGTSPSSSSLLHAPSRINADGETEVDDHVCWTIVGISKFEHSYVEALGPVSTPVTPFPTLTGPVTIRSITTTDARAMISTTTPTLLDFSILDFFPPTLTHSTNLQPLEVWLGHSGPLSCRFTRLNPNQFIAGSRDECFVSVDLPTYSTQDLLQMASSSSSLDSSPTDTGLPSSENSPTPIVTKQPLLLIRSDGVVYHMNTVVVYELLGGEKIDVRVEAV